MCGFTGRILYGRGNISQEEIERSLYTIKHRGPDDSGIFIKDRVGLGHNRLAIVDKAHGKQPMHANSGRKVTIVYNGEIYNLNELRRLINGRNYVLKSYSDTEIVLALYLLYGEESFSLLNGMYAFAIFDQDRDEVFLCRDRFGIKPLYYMETKKAFSFASEVKALKVYSDYSFEVELEAINEYITFQFYISDKSPYKSIKTLPSGSYLRFKEGKYFIESYYKPQLSFDHSINYEEAKCNINTLCENAIISNTISDVPIGTYLSGGIDSSIISSVLGLAHNDIKMSFTGAFSEGMEFDETKYASLVAQKHEVDHEIIYCGVDDFTGSIEKIMHLMDYPESGPGVFPQYMVSGLASNFVKVVLGGQGGDEIFGGYTRYFIAYLEQSLKGAIFETQDAQKHIGILNELINNLPILKNYIPMLSEFWKNNLFGDKERRYYDLINRKSGSEILYNQDYLKIHSDEKNFEKFIMAFGSDDQSYFSRMTMFDLKHSMQGLLHVEDRVSMAHSVESRVPLIDYKIIDYVNKIPPVFKFKTGKLKNILVDSFKHVLPKEIVGRKDKMGFPVPLNVWKKDKKFQTFLSDILLSDSAMGRGIFNKKALEDNIFHREGFNRGLWGVLSLELWLRQNDN